MDTWKSDSSVDLDTGEYSPPRPFIAPVEFPRAVQQPTSALDIAPRAPTASKVGPAHAQRGSDSERRLPSRSPDPSFYSSPSRSPLPGSVGDRAPPRQFALRDTGLADPTGVDASGGSPRSLAPMPKHEPDAEQLPAPPSSAFAAHLDRFRYASPSPSSRPPPPRLVHPSPQRPVSRLEPPSDRSQSTPERKLPPRRRSTATPPRPDGSSRHFKRPADEMPREAADGTLGVKVEGGSETPKTKKKKRPARPYADPSTYAELGADPLTDYLRHGLDLLLCGINPGVKSAQLGLHCEHRALHGSAAVCTLTDRLALRVRRRFADEPLLEGARWIGFDRSPVGPFRRTASTQAVRHRVDEPCTSSFCGGAFELPNRAACSAFSRAEECSLSDVRAIERGDEGGRPSSTAQDCGAQAKVSASHPPLLLLALTPSLFRMVAFVGMKICEIVLRHLHNLPSPSASSTTVTTPDSDSPRKKYRRPASPTKRKKAMPKVKVGLQPVTLSFPPEQEGAAREKLYFWCLPSTSARVVEYQLVDKIKIFGLLKSDVSRLTTAPGTPFPVPDESVDYPVEMLFAPDQPAPGRTWTVTLLEAAAVKAEVKAEEGMGMDIKAGEGYKGVEKPERRVCAAGGAPGD
ncbi:SPOSA6832_04534, partial [Sporobolomyces salmonicolor]